MHGSYKFNQLNFEIEKNRVMNFSNQILVSHGKKLLNFLGNWNSLVIAICAQFNSVFFMFVFYFMEKKNELLNKFLQLKIEIRNVMN